MGPSSPRMPCSPGRRTPDLGQGHEDGPVISPVSWKRGPAWQTGLGAVCSARSSSCRSDFSASVSANQSSGKARSPPAASTACHSRLQDERLLRARKIRCLHRLPPLPAQGFWRGKLQLRRCSFRGSDQSLKPDNLNLRSSDSEKRAISILRDKSGRNDNLSNALRQPAAYITIFCWINEPEVRK